MTNVTPFRKPSSEPDPEPEPEPILNPYRDYRDRLYRNPDYKPWRIGPSQAREGDTVITSTGVVKI